MNSPNFYVLKASKRSTVSSNRPSVYERLSNKEREILNDFERRLTDSRQSQTASRRSSNVLVNQINEESSLLTA
jgi:hypothetical protein